MKQVRIALVHEINNNPHFNNGEVAPSFTPELMHPAYSEALQEAIRKITPNFILIDGAKEFLSSLNRIKKEIDFVFNKARGFKGIDRKSQVPILCEMISMPYLGSKASSMALARHKYLCNRLLKGVGIKVPECYFIPNNKTINLKEEDFKFPLLVKPNDLSTSMGINENSLVFFKETLRAQLEFMFQGNPSDAILEEFIPGREFKVAVIGSENPTVVGGVEVLKSNRSITDNYVMNADLWSKKISYSTHISKELVNKLYPLAIKVYKILGLDDYGRIDIRVGNSNELYVIEVSTHPEINVHSAFTMACLPECEEYDKVIQLLLNVSFKRWGLLFELNLRSERNNYASSSK